ncbi:MAG: WXG100 family type VII secretion target [Caldilineaceae bacterium]
MSGDVVQAQYEQLDAIAQRFGHQAQAMHDLQQSVQRGVQLLRNGGWEGRGADAFFAEMDQKLLPAMQRLSNALTTAQATTLQVKAIVQKAEEEASQPFRNGSPAPSTSGTKNPPEVVAARPGTFDGRRQPFTIGAPQEAPGHNFASGKADALKYDIKIGAQTIPVYVPKAAGGGASHIHSVEEISKGLAALPEANRNLVKQVNVNPGLNPDDAYWAKQYHDPNFRSYMTAGAKGIVDVYPTSSATTQDYLDGTMIHETGHIWSNQKWGSDHSNARWNDWKTAMKSDSVSASRYAQNSPGEDFSETLQLYHQVKGTPEEAVMRARMPQRFKIIDEIVAGKR